MKKLQTLLQFLLVPLTLWLVAYSASLRAEDIDIYVDNSGTSGVPNVLFVIDNSSNLASTWNGGGCSAYGGTSEAPSLGTDTAGGVIQCALVDAINSLPNGTLNIGLMAGNEGGYATSTPGSSSPANHEICANGDGGCLLRKLTLMTGGDAGSKKNLVNFIKSWTKNSSSSTQFDFTISKAYSGQMMQEAWAYFNGQTGISGKSYSPSLLQACQRNFIIYIGNTDKATSNDDVSGPGALTAAGATAKQLKKIEEKAVFKPPVCGSISVHNYSGSASDWSSNWSDEWARLMYQQDSGTGTQEGMQNIITYGIGIINETVNQCTADYPALLSKMAQHGGGKFFRVSDASQMTEALMSALNEVQAVNSVFSSASLPVSVNAEGSYLNQIFLGMFRPDGTGSPRWLGNLKQYQLIRNGSGQLVMGDAEGKPAISSGGTGFLAPDAVSLWTYKDTANLPDNVGGFFVNDPKGTPAQGFDRADGEVVEKGGVAQQLRKQNLTATFAGAGGTSSNPRKMYTYCPSGGICNPDLTDPSNDFSTANASIAAAAFGSAVTVPVTSIVRTGTSALVTTAGNHGFSTGSIVTIRNANQNAYNVTQAVTVPAGSLNTFTITGLPDWPASPSAGTYTVALPNVSTTGSYTIDGLSRSSSTSTGSATETVTVKTSGTHDFVLNDLVKISGVTPTEYNRDGWQVTGTTADTFTFDVPVSPSKSITSPGNWRVVHAGYTRAIDSITRSPGAVKVWTVETNTAHGFRVGQTVTISGVNSDYNKDWVVQTIPSGSTTRFTIQPANNPGSAGTGSVTPLTTPRTVTALTRTGTEVNTTAVMTVAEANWFANGDRVKISYVAGDPGNNSAYLGITDEVTITCSNADCTTFTYPIVATPPLNATVLGKVSRSVGGSATILPGNMTRIGTTVQVTGIAAGTFLDGQTVEISPSGASLASEAAYVNSWRITCTVVTDCSTFTFGPVALFPASPATGNRIQAYSGTTSPDKDSLIKWLRGEDNAGDEKGPGSPVTVRPSIHGDVLHSRPLVINYGDSRGIVVFYGSNDGVYRAVNGNQDGSNNGAPAGGELWGLILPDHYQLINRYRSNSPEIKFPASYLPSAQPKDYFVDGPTGVYQKLNPDNTIAKAYIYLTMRRGGRFIYALDVTQPAQPRVVWKISHQDIGFEELGQTWSRPRLTLLQNLKSGTPAVPTPVLVFGAGYDNAQDAEPPTADSSGRGIFVVNAETGALVWSASTSCLDGVATCKKVDAMKYATPGDIGFVDRDLNGFIDKFYWGDLGGNVWRADVSDADVANWKVKRIAQLGCDTGECASGTTPRKFFFPPAVLSVRPAGAANSYEALSIVSGDREHPLRNTAANSSYHVTDKFFMIKDLGTIVGAPDLAPSTSEVTASSIDLFDATSALYDGTRKGFYISLKGGGTSDTKGEKGVNSPVAVNGQIFFSTNRPVQRDVNTCSANLGEAKAYAVSPFTGQAASNVLAGGGLAPSAVTGLITITETDANGNTTSTQEKFCIGCGLSGSQAGGTNTAPCTSALENCNVGTVIPKDLKRTYWYKQ